jgi:tetratricopeptide (TPR) repeat protein
VERLEASGEKEAYERRHAQFLVRRIERGLPGEDDRVALERMAEELGNIRSALAWAQERGDVEVGLRLLGVLWWYWYARGPLDEGIAWAEALLALDQANRRGGRRGSAARARALHGLTALNVRKSDFVAAVAFGEDSLAAWREVGDPEGIANALNALANAALALDDLTRARALFEESLALARTLGAPDGIARPLAGLAGVALERAEYARAEALIVEALALTQDGKASGRALDTAGWLNCLGEVFLRQGDFARAEPLFAESLRHYHNLGSTRGAAIVLWLQAQLAYRVGDLERTDALLEESLASYREQGVRWGIAKVLAVRADVARTRGDIARAVELYHESLVLRRRTPARLGLIEGLEGLARVASLRGQWEDAVRWWAVAQAQREALGAPRWPIDQPAYERDLTALRAALSDEAFGAAWAAGSDTTLEQALDEMEQECRA